ncbi:LysR family transcriptional regulator [Salipiger sp. P9]|uniref:LysR family transcriptional regulator n=1 Tax=Salipiger pentaromativorans TaxID=2943193 RepID=UPI0021589011|nr:LysR family transcriptional regulator [Salipiger pentaromativorans]MCR8547576.1 LysR family transcriptional regulator [Salipiger pentaromativorans]
MDIKLLGYFLRIVELGSINKAAIDLGMSQPTLSRNLALLEHEVGTDLLVRSRGGVRTTEAGKILRDQSRPLLRQFDLLREQIGQKAQGNVTIGFPTALRSVLTRKFAERILTRNLGIKVRVSETVSHMLREQMDAGLLDMCIAPEDTSLNQEHRQRLLVREPLVLAGGPRSGLSPDRPVRIRDLAGRKMIIPARPNLLRAKFEHEMARKGATLDVAMETDTLALCLELSATGLGYTVVPASAMTNPVASGRVLWAPVEGLTLGWALYSNPMRNHSRAVRECRKEILQILRETAGGSGWSGAVAPREKDCV